MWVPAGSPGPRHRRTLLGRLQQIFFLVVSLRLVAIVRFAFLVVAVGDLFIGGRDRVHGSWCAGRSTKRIVSDTLKAHGVMG